MADDESKQEFLAALRTQLDQSRQQQIRLRDALTRMLRLADEDQRP